MGFIDKIFDATNTNDHSGSINVSLNDSPINNLKYSTVRIGNGANNSDGYQGLGFFIVPDMVLCCRHTIETILLASEKEIKAYEIEFLQAKQGTVLYENIDFDFALIKVEKEDFKNSIVIEFDYEAPFYNVPITFPVIIQGEQKIINGTFSKEYSKIVSMTLEGNAVTEEMKISINKQYGSPVSIKGSNKLRGYLIPVGNNDVALMPITEEITNKFSKVKPNWNQLRRNIFSNKKIVSDDHDPIKTCEKEIKECLDSTEKIKILQEAIAKCTANKDREVKLIKPKPFLRKDFLDALENVFCGDEQNDWFVEKHNSFLKRLVLWPKKELECYHDESSLLLLYFSLKFLSDELKNMYLEKTLSFLSSAIEYKFKFKLVGDAWKGDKTFTYLRILEDTGIKFHSSVFWFLLTYGNISLTESEQPFEDKDWIEEWKKDNTIDALKKACSDYREIFPSKKPVLSGDNQYGNHIYSDLRSKHELVYNKRKKDDFRLQNLKHEFEEYQKKQNFNWESGHTFMQCVSLFVQNDTHEKKAYKIAFGA